MSEGGWDLGDVLVLIDHPFGKVERPLRAWMVDGPGPRNARPVSARSKSTGEALPLTVIPLAYRNDRESQALIEAGKIASPWPDRSLPAFGRQVASPQEVDRLAARVINLVPQGVVDAKDAQEVLLREARFGDMASFIVRRLAAEARWEEFDTIIRLAGAAMFIGIGPVLCEVLESDAMAPRPGHIIDVLAQIGFDGAAEVLRRLLGRFIYADRDLPNARRCLHALAVIGGPRSRAMLTLISWDDWPAPIPEWAAQELGSTGERIPSPLAEPEGRAPGNL